MAHAALGSELYFVDRILIIHYLRSLLYVCVVFVFTLFYTIIKIVKLTRAAPP